MPDGVGPSTWLLKLELGVLLPEVPLVKLGSSLRGGWRAWRVVQLFFIWLHSRGWAMRGCAPWEVASRPESEGCLRSNQLEIKWQSIRNQMANKQKSNGKQAEIKW